MFPVHIRGDYLSIQGLEAHAGKQNAKDYDDGSRDYPSCDCGVLAFPVVAQEMGAGEQVDFSEKLVHHISH